MLHPNTYFDKIYCLNLDRRPDRWRNTLTSFLQWGVQAERFPAVDGESPFVAGQYREYLRRLASSGPSSCNPPLASPGALGCLLSHTKILESAIQNRHQRILIFEDDVKFHRSFLAEFQKVRKLPSNWKLLYLGASQHDWHQVTLGGNGFYCAKRSLGTFAVAIDRSIFNLLISLFCGSQLPVDQYLLKAQESLPGQCFVAFPNLVIADVSESEIRPSRRPWQHAAKMKWDLALYQTPDHDTSIAARMTLPRCQFRRTSQEVSAIVKCRCPSVKTNRGLVSVSTCIGCRFAMP